MKKVVTSLSRMIELDRKIINCDEPRYLRAFKKYEKSREIVQTKLVGCKRTLLNTDGYTYICARNGGMAGVHLIKRVRKQIVSKVKSGELSFPDLKGDFKIRTNFYNEKNCYSHYRSGFVGGVYAVDINNCYWQMLYSLGWIDAELYRYGLVKSEWKRARNASVGSLGKRTLITDYSFNERGEYVYRRRVERCEYNPFRLYLIGKIFRDCLTFAISDQLRDNFLYYLTDCFFVKEAGVPAVKAYFDSLGFKYKVKKYDNFVFCVDGNKRFCKWDFFEEGSEELKRVAFSSVNEIWNAGREIGVVK